MMFRVVAEVFTKVFGVVASVYLDGCHGCLLEWFLWYLGHLLGCYWVVHMVF